MRFGEKADQIVGLGLPSPPVLCRFRLDYKKMLNILGDFFSSIEFAAFVLE
jgi:hypothetical protein